MIPTAVQMLDCGWKWGQRREVIGAAFQLYESRGELWQHGESSVRAIQICKRGREWRQSDKNGASYKRKLGEPCGDGGEAFEVPASTS